jgi:peptidoglycan/LPS O-acetylase OafA/YrhL
MAQLILSLSTAPGTLVAPSPGLKVAPASKVRRIPALDFTKGALVLIMVLYHWMNYFVRADGSTYKYLRFLTPSFIFITGFLISQVYLSRADSIGLRIPGRLLRRGLKLLGIVACLNIALSRMASNGFGPRLNPGSPGNVAMAYLAGTSPVSFSVLVPIAYLLIVSAALLIASRYYRNTYYITCAFSLACALLLELKGVDSGYLQIFSIGTLGIIIGHVQIDRLNKFVKHWALIISSYLAYLCAITLWDVIYPLQIVGVCLSVAIIYWLGIKYAGSNYIGKTTVLLGQYSLVAYIVQIIILQILRRGLRSYSAVIGLSEAAFVACIGCMILIVAVLDRTRVRVSALNKLYTAVFC